MNAPCKDCESRRPKCHATCSLYKDWLEIEHKKREHERTWLSDFDSFHVDNIAKARRKYHHE